jgi:HSP20 family protein
MNIIPWRKREHLPITRRGFGTGMTDFRREMDRLFDRFSHGAFMESPWEPLAEWHTGEFVPSVDISEKEKEITIRCEVPGLAPEDIDISVSGNVLTVRGEKQESSEQKDENFYHCERSFGAFSRSIELPPTADPAKIEAEGVNGVLTIHVAKLPAAKSKKISIKPSQKAQLTSAT